MSDYDMSPGAGAMFAQLAPVIKGFMDRINPLLDQPVIRMPYSMPLARGQVIAAGAAGVVLSPTDFTFNFEWPFEVHAIKFSQDVGHTFRDWRINFQDMTFQQPMQKATSLVADLVDDNTGKWVWEFPWIIRPKGGGMTVTVDNLDTINPITVDIAFLGYELIPR
jgi:hypothetical protein